ncbi:hypothetical protein [Iningainema tapete]|uniref:Uncharacterized protein n=1 Tax=Iningainema tapete BLCC-T55 TaxID=2748662 RepID=A0A8J6XGJ9_9CYAN|nr:hypothetical protein [Iningainema tapete]MBD2771611.1 hypothetical protein [Iningainema tapete BLCC-T55]
MSRKHPLHVLQQGDYTAKIYPPDNLGYGVYVYCNDSPLCGFWRKTEKQALEDAKKDLENWAIMSKSTDNEKFSLVELRSLYGQFRGEYNTAETYGDDVIGFLNWLETDLSLSPTLLKQKQPV